MAGEVVVIRGSRGGWKIVSPEGNIRAKRHRLKHAEDVANRINLGIPPIPERRQVLADWPVLRIVTKSNKSQPFYIVDKNGVPIRRFTEKWKAEWWLGKYQERRKLRHEAFPRRRDEKDLLDWIDKRWLVAEELIDYDQRVEELTRMLKAGRE